jgi:phospholipase D1/2
MKPKTFPLLPLALVAAAVVGTLWFLAYRYLTLEDVKQLADTLSLYASENQPTVIAALLGAQMIGMAFSMPTKALLTIMAGALLGPVVGFFTTFTGVLIGTTGLFFATRNLFGHSARERFGHRAQHLEERLRRRPILAIAGLRLLVNLPYGPITIIAALTDLRYRNFLFGSFLGDIPIVLLYSLAGERLATLNSASEAISPLTIVILSATGILLIVGALGERKNSKEKTRS